jgi:hypothetical protein
VSGQMKASPWGVQESAVLHQGQHHVHSSTIVSQVGGLLSNPAERAAINLEAAYVACKSGRNLLALIERNGEVDAIASIVFARADSNIARSTSFEAEGGSEAEEGDECDRKKGLHCDGSNEIVGMGGMC